MGRRDGSRCAWPGSASTWRCSAPPRCRRSASDTNVAAAAMVEARDRSAGVRRWRRHRTRPYAKRCRDRFPVIGVPAGVKMHSGVFAVTPRDAACSDRAVARWWISLRPMRLRCATSTKPRCAKDVSRRVTTANSAVPRVGGFLQHVKSSGREVEELVLAEIAESVAERVAGYRGALVLGPGSTLAAIKRRLGIEADAARVRRRCEGRHVGGRGCGCARTCNARRCKHGRRAQLHARPGLPDRTRQSAADAGRSAKRHAREHLGRRRAARNCCRSKADRCSSIAERRTSTRSCAASSRSSAATKTRCSIASGS